MNGSQNGLINWFSTNKSYIGYGNPVGVLVLSVLGLIVWILGYRLVKPIVIVAAFVFAGVGFYSLSPDVLDTEFCCDGNHSLEVRISISIICGLLAGALACYVYKIGVFCMGCIVGWAFSIVIVTFFVSQYLKSDLAYYGIYGATGLLFGILAVWLEKVFIIIATSLIGSLMFLLGLDHYCRTAFSILIKQILFKTKDAFSQAANHPARVKLEFHEAHKEFTNQGDFSLSFNHLGPVHSAPEKFENAAGFLQLGQPSTLIRLENALQNGAIEKTPACRFSVDGKHFETKLFENDGFRIIT